VETLRKVRPAPGQIALALIYALLALNAWAQVIFALRGELSDPPILIGLQSLIGIAGAAAAWGSWVGARWAAYAVVVHGLTTAAMLVALDPILGLGADARSRLFIAAAAVLAWTFLFAWYLNRLVRRRQVKMTARDDPGPWRQT
jgi:hypothetical protein